MVEKITHTDLFTEDANIRSLFNLLGEIPDPEIPVINIRELGVLRSIEKTAEGYRVLITPTYSGCPAMDMIATQIRLTLAEHGWKNVEVKEQLSPAWTTDWLTEQAQKKLKEYGIAPPQTESKNICCPNCGAAAVEIVSEFGSTSCKSLYRCLDCKEPFDYFKCH